MPNFKRMREFVTYVDEYNTRDNDEDEATLNNLVDENYQDIKAIKEDNALRKFKDKTGYDKTRVADTYMSCKKFGYLQRRDKSNSTHVQGVAIMVTEDGKDFIETSQLFNWQKGRWHEIVKHYGSWSIVISLVALAVSIFSVYIAYKK